jgi:archaellum component FlaF (FlaF/FlaG flagellin family)
VAYVNNGVLTLELTEANSDGNYAEIESLAILPLQFQSNPTSTSATAGVTPISSSTTYYSAGPGYGFSPQDDHLNNVSGAVYATDMMTFEVDLPDGLYDVTPTIGDRANSPQNDIQVFLQGEPSNSATTDVLWASAGQSVSQTYLAIVTDGQLSIEFVPGPGSGTSVYLDSLTIIPRSTPLDFAFGPSGTAVSAGSDAVSNYTHYDTDPGYGFGPCTGLNVPSGGSPYVYASVMTFEVDLPDGSYEVTPTLRGTGGASDEVQVMLQGSPVGEPSTTDQASPSYVAYVNNGVLTLELTEANSDGNYAEIESLVITPSSLPTIGDFGFEAYQVGAGNYHYDPSGSAWTFSGSSPNGSGLAANNSAFTSGNPSAPQGDQVAFLQGTGTITQSVSDWAAGSYTISFDAAQRGSWNGSMFVPQAQNFEVLIDGTVVSTFLPTSTSYQEETTATFTVTAGTHTIEFLGVDSATGDNTVLIDDVTVAQATPPSVPMIGDAGFEEVSVANAPGGYEYNPSDPEGWTFSAQSGNSGSGLAANNSGFTSGNPSAPQGDQVAFLQASGSITQSVSDWAAGSYTISFDAAQRGNHGTSEEDFEVLIDGTVVSTFLPTSTSYQEETTATFTVTAGTHTIEFLGVDSATGDNTVLIDDVTVAIA